MYICIFIIIVLIFSTVSIGYPSMKYKQIIGYKCQIVEAYKPFFVCIFQSSLAAARADNFYYPPEWTPKQVSLLFNHISKITFPKEISIL